MQVPENKYLLEQCVQIYLEEHLSQLFSTELQRAHILLLIWEASA